MDKSRKENDNDFEIQFYEDLLKKKPDFDAALGALGDLYTKEGRYQEGLDIDKKLALLKPDDPIVLYNLACSYSLMNDVDNALVNIKRSIERGYDDLSYIEQDNDLFNLRSDQRFKEYLLSIKKGHLK